MKLRILTINVQNDEGDPRRLGLINSELRRLDPDIVTFQEVLGTRECDQLVELLDGTDVHGTHQAQAMAYTPPWEDRYGGSAVATRWPHRVLEVLDLRLLDAADVPWCTLAVSIPLPGQGDLLFIAATASWRLEAESARERQAVALTELDARHRGALPTIIAGDFNASPDAASIRYLPRQRSRGSAWARPLRFVRCERARWPHSLVNGRARVSVKSSACGQRRIGPSSAYCRV